MSTVKPYTMEELKHAVDLLIEHKSETVAGTRRLVGAAITYLRSPDTCAQEMQERVAKVLEACLRHLPKGDEG